ncbi:MAG: hypothetical protein A2X49_04045 [Lentisphaerae bacterium GWF2_52_8]|nr:MAG: hypothetical protein A2X49_04045 [Lentisphaerae bacterium GWF2_52_8]
MAESFQWAVRIMLFKFSGVDIREQVFLENDYLRAELNAIMGLYQKDKRRLRLSLAVKAALAQKAKLLGRRIYEVANIVTPETLFRWYRELVAKKFDSSRAPRRSPGRPLTEAEIEQNILKIAQENKTWGYDKIAGALENIGLVVCPSTVANVMKRNGLNPSGDRKKGGMSWGEFLRIQKDAIWATDFFTSEVWTPFGLTTFYILFFIQIKTRKVVLGSISLVSPCATK